MRGQTPSGEEETLNFSGYKPGHAYRLVEFVLYPTTSLGSENIELSGSVTAAKTAMDPANPDFNSEGLIATALLDLRSNNPYSSFASSVVNDTFLVTQNLLLKVFDADGGGPVNWQCRFVAEKMTKAEEAVTNYKQFTIFD